MDKYLLEILKNVNTIIIPGLGALTITNHETGEIMFMPYLQHDDGKLSSYISEKEGIEEVDAKNLIAKYVREITTKLDQGDTYDMFQFGTFKKDDAGDTVFINWNAVSNEETSLEIDEVKPDENTPSVEKIVAEEEIVEEKENTIATEVFVVTEEKEEKSQDVVESKIEDEVQPETVTSISIDEEIKEENAVSKKEMNIAEKEEVQKNQEKLAKLREQKENKLVRRKRGVGFYMLISLLVIIVVGGVYVGLNYNELKQHVPFLADSKEIKDKPSALDEMKDMMGLDSEENESEADPINELDENVTIAEPEEEIETELEAEKEIIKEEKIGPKQTSPSSGNYHVIAGAFSSEANANKLGEKLRSEGFTVRVGKGNGMNLVSIKSFDTKEDAQANLNDLKSSAPRAWIYYWPN